MKNLQIKILINGKINNKFIDLKSIWWLSTYIIKILQIYAFSKNKSKFILKIGNQYLKAINKKK